MKIFKPGTKTPEELKYEEKFEKLKQMAAEHNTAKNYNSHLNKKHKKCFRRPHIPIYQVDNKTCDILAEFYSMNQAAASINMTGYNFSTAMMDRPIYKPVLIKGKWFIKKSHYEQWKINQNTP